MQSSYTVASSRIAFTLTVKLCAFLQYYICISIIRQRDQHTCTHAVQEELDLLWNILGPYNNINT